MEDKELEKIKRIHREDLLRGYKELEKGCMVCEPIPGKAIAVKDVRKPICIECGKKLY